MLINTCAGIIKLYKIIIIIIFNRLKHKAMHYNKLFVFNYYYYYINFYINKIFIAADQIANLV